MILSVPILLVRSGSARLTGNTWEHLGTPVNDWEARQQDHKTARQRDNETARQRKHKKKRGHRPQYPEVPQKTQPFSGFLSRSQSFSVFLSCARQCATTTLPSEMNFCQKGCRCVLSQKRVPWDSTKTYSPRHSTFWDGTLMRPYTAKRLL